MVLILCIFIFTFSCKLGIGFYKISMGSSNFDSGLSCWSYYLFIRLFIYLYGQEIILLVISNKTLRNICVIERAKDEKKGMEVFAAKALFFHNLPFVVMALSKIIHAFTSKFIIFLVNHLEINILNNA